MLGDVPTNNRTVEIQMMNRFLRDSHLVNISFPEGIDDHESIKKCYENLFDEKVERGTLNELKLVDVAQTAFLASRKFDPVDKPCWIGVRNLVFPRSFESHILTKDLHQHLKISIVTSIPTSMKILLYHTLLGKQMKCTETGRICLLVNIPVATSQASSWPIGLKRMVLLRHLTPCQQNQLLVK